VAFALGWSREQFWRSTPGDVRDAWRGWMEMNGHAKPDEDPEMDELRRLNEQELAQENYERRWGLR
jgi:hypothetical protein